MGNKKLFKLKIIDDTSKESIAILLDYSQLTGERIKASLPFCTQIVTTSDSQLLFVGDKDCKLELESLYNLASLIQSMLLCSMTWDVIDQLPPEEKQVDHLDGILILNKQQ